jgi:glycosyltransferase involved in cell wall biosynthesis
VTSSLIIITFNRAALLERTLAGLTRQTRQIDEVIVVDNGPTADTERVACSFTARYVPEPRRGYANARNRGLAEAGGEVIYFLDDDCVPEPDWADVLWKVLDSGAADLASGSRAPGQPGLAARLEYLSTDGPVLSPALTAGPARHLSTSNLI